jgi:hypothetical protein
VQALAEAARAAVGPASLAVLFYGSALRDGGVSGRLVDLYVVVDAYAALPASALSRLLVRLFPPNVYYLETTGESGPVRAKFAVVALPHLERLVGRAESNPYFWARIAQPTAIAWARDANVRDRLVAAMAQSCDTLLAATRPLLPPGTPSAELWRRAFVETYRTELRAERADRALALYAANAARYDRIAALLAGRPAETASAQTARRRWRRRRIGGKALSVLRLVKAAFTFQGGADYLAWKIERHSGVTVPLSDWQRRHPLLAAPGLFWRLYRAGAVR